MSLTICIADEDGQTLSEMKVVCSSLKDLVKAIDCGFDSIEFITCSDCSCYFPAKEAVEIMSRPYDVFCPNCGEKQ